jgi:hypothetical protein
LVVHGRFARRVAAIVVLGLLLSACNAGGLNFREDRRLSILAPDDLQTVSLPVTIRWEMKDFDVLDGPDGSGDGGRGRFAVFLDRTPMPPGKDLDWLARNDDSCRPNPDCPNEKWLNDRKVWVLSETELTFETMAVRDERGRDLHEATIVLLDGRNRRIGESAFAVEFVVDRPDPEDFS